ncbi:MAG: glutathione S-transferase C-terminal domain-containing protein [Acidimicrobiales bacterium]|jgi:glutathione S-transferase|nr:glutathione S-transferase C-terminal domain-containing protein [Acidimicrobiales bacterium]
MTYTLYGAPVSLYTGKARSYLRRQGIDFVEESPGFDRYLNHIVPTVGRWIIPCLETPDGTIIQDGADIIDHFEKGDGQSLRQFSIYPESPVLLAIGHVFELFGGEGLLRPAMHYRWNFDEENLAFLASEFSVLVPASVPQEDAEAQFPHNSGRMRKAALNFGVVPEAMPLIETAFEEFLDLFSAHLVDQPYLLGGQPTIGDFGLIAAMWAHLFRDPAPMALVKRRAPRVGRWVERMTTSEPFLHEYDTDGSLIDDTELPDTLIALMGFVAEEYLPEITAHVERANQWLDENPDIEAGTNGLENPANRGLEGGRGLVGNGAATFAWRGIELTTGVMPYRFWLMQKLHDDLAAANEADQERTRHAFASAGLDGILDLRTLRRVERDGHLEVWGPLV